MTREEADKWLEETIQDTDTYFSSCSEALQKELDEQKEVFLLALTALRPVSREQVERMRGAWARTCSTDNFWTEVWKCSYCGFEDDNGDCFDFCPECGQPKTEEAVEMVMERLEGMDNGTVPCDNA